MIDLSKVGNDIDNMIENLQTLKKEGRLQGIALVVFLDKDAVTTDYSLSNAQLQRAACILQAEATAHWVNAEVVKV